MVILEYHSCYVTVLQALLPLLLPLKISLNDCWTLVLTRSFSFRSSRVVYARVCRTRPTRRHTMWPVSLLAISNRTSATILLLRGPHLGSATTMFLPSRGVTSPTPLAVPAAKVPWLLRPLFLLRIHVIHKAALVRGSLRVPMQLRAFMPQSLPHHQRNARGPFTIPKIHPFQRQQE
jgi:hypothetical protein